MVNENPSDGSRVVLCGRRDRRSDMTKLLVGSRNCTKAPKEIMTANPLS